MELPMDLISDNILSRLPVKSLLRFKSVSKSWNAHIKSPYFIEKHKNMADIIHTLPSSTLLIEYIYQNKDKIGRLNLVEAPDKRITLDLPFSYGGFVHVLGISNGLVCIMNDHEPMNIIVIFNPATREFRKIPPCKKSDWHSHLNCFGFGFLANRYELIRIASDAHGTKANSYSMDTNTWRDLNVKVCRPDTRPASFMTRKRHKKIPVLQNGVFYWGTCWETYWDTHFECKVLVTSFNVYNEVLEEIPALPIAYDTVWKLIVIKEEVAVVISHASGFDVWVLNEKEKTWTMKHFVKSPNIESYAAVLGGTKSGELLMVGYYSGTSKVFSYNMHNGYVDFFPFVINGVTPIWNENFVLYNESLTSVRIGDNEVEDVLDSRMMKRTMKKKAVWLNCFFWR